MGIATLNHIADVSVSDNMLRKQARAELDLLGSYPQDCKVCPKPVWFTAFFDGTGNNAQLDGLPSRSAKDTKYSNIAKLAQFAHIENDSDPRTAFAYVEGVGTPCSKVGDSGNGVDNALGMAAARKGEDRIRWMLAQLKRFVDSHAPHVSQVNLAVFGFSRGATQARGFVRMLKESLAVGPEDSHLFWQDYSYPNLPKLVVYFVGILDTVSSTGYGGSRLESALPSVILPGTPVGAVAGGVLSYIDKGGHAEWAKDLRIPGHVKRCVHYVAAHEVREKFPSDSVRLDRELPGNCIEEFYPGVHSDVGGGYANNVQEGRTNELSRVALNNLFIQAWRAGVPLKPPNEVLETAGSLFQISDDLQHHWNVYMGECDAPSVQPIIEGGDLQHEVVWHMNRYYQWRASRRNRLRDGRLKPQPAVDQYMQIADREWQDDLISVARSATGLIRFSLNPQEEAMFDAYKGEWLRALPADYRMSFDRFFDHYVHDSIAGFKQQMSDSHIGFVEMSRWARNRQYFVGKREDKFLYWRYEGWLPYSNEMKVAREDARNAKGPLPTNADATLPEVVTA